MIDKTSQTVFRSFIKQLSRTTVNAYSNHPKVIQSSVGMIFRLKSANQYSTPQQIVEARFDQIDLLFTQRAGYEKDKNAYNIVFPGGQCDGAQTDFDACKRQLMEQVHLAAQEHCFYLGQLPSNFYYLKKRGSKVFISCHVWCLKPNYNNWQPSLNPDELRDFRWVPYAQLLDTANYITNNALRLGIIERALPASVANSISRNILSFKLPELNLGMDRNLWGLTLWIWSYSLQMARRDIVDTIEADLSQKAIIKMLGHNINHAKLLEIDFKPYYILKWPLLGLLRGWHVLNRERPFNYERKLETRAKINLVCLLFIVAAVFSLVNLKLL